MHKWFLLKQHLEFIIIELSLIMTKLLDYSGHWFGKIKTTPFPTVYCSNSFFQNAVSSYVYFIIPNLEVLQYGLCHNGYSFFFQIEGRPCSSAVSHMCCMLVVPDSSTVVKKVLGGRTRGRMSLQKWGMQNNHSYLSCIYWVWSGSLHQPLVLVKPAETPKVCHHQLWRSHTLILQIDRW